MGEQEYPGMSHKGMYVPNGWSLKRKKKVCGLFSIFNFQKQRKKNTISKVQKD